MRGKDTKERIVEEAFALFASRGFHACEVELFPQQQGVGVEQGGEIFDCAATGTHDEARVYLRTPHQDPFPVAQGDPSCFFQPPAA